MRRALLACLLAGCYHGSNLACAVTCAADQSCPDGLQCGLSDHLCHAGPRECSEIDAGLPDDTGMPPLEDAPDTAPGAPFCDRSDIHIIACYEFENTTDNESMYPLSTTPSEVAFQGGMIGFGQALQLSDTSTVQIAETMSLDLQQFTVEAWLDPSPPSAMIIKQNVTVVNNPGQYGMFIGVGGAPYCAYVTDALPTPIIHAVGQTALPVNQWTHVACVYDGTTLALYVNGSFVIDDRTGARVVTSSMLGTGIGSDMVAKDAVNHYDGLIDNLRILSAARTKAQICADAGRKDCP